MEQPEGFVDLKNRSRVCKLNKAVYGLKQAGRQWSIKLNSVLTKFCFTQCKKDESIFVFRQGKTVTFLAVYVDDFVVFGNNLAMIDKLFEYLSCHFEVKDLGHWHYMLGIEVSCDMSKKTFSLSQKHIHQGYAGAVQYGGSKSSTGTCGERRGI